MKSDPDVIPRILQICLIKGLIPRIDEEHVVRSDLKTILPVMKYPLSIQYDVQRKFIPDVGTETVARMAFLDAAVIQIQRRYFLKCILYGSKIPEELICLFPITFYLFTHAASPPMFIEKVISLPYLC